MATRALAAAAAVAGRRVAGQSWSSAALTATTRRGGAHQTSSSNSTRGAHAQAEEPPEPVTAALNRKNVEEVAQELGTRAATVLPDEVVRNQDADAAWVPDQETGVFVPAEEAAADGPSTAASSVLDQTVFNREEEMEDVERPAVDMDDDA